MTHRQIYGACSVALLFAAVLWFFTEMTVLPALVCFSAALVLAYMLLDDEIE